MVSDAVHQPDIIGVYGSAQGRLAEVPATLWLWGAAGAALDSVLRQHQGIECVYWCDLFLADRFLHGPL